ncbi:MAG: Trk system potassium transporter TrkA [Desulfovibrionaceae bacterium]
MAFFFTKNRVERKKVVIVGAGEVGYHIARRLTQENKEVTVIDLNPERLKRITDNLDVQVVLGSGSSPAVLKEAGSDSASVFLAVTSSDEANIMACLFANAIAPKAMILARLRNAEYAGYPELFGKNGLRISMMVSPEKEVVRTIDRLLSLPGSTEYAEFAEGRIRMVAYRMDEQTHSKSAVIGQPLMRFRELAHDDGIMVSAIARNNKLIIPTGKDVLEFGDVVYFVYRQSSQKALLRLLGRTRAFFNTVCIVGGGTIGMLLAKLYEEKGMDVKLIDMNEQRCEELATNLNSTLVLHGDGTDKTLLLEENIPDMDVLIAASSDEETNILACLLAKSLGTRTTVARVNKPGYLSLVESIGIDHGVSPRQSAVNTLLNFIRQGKMLSSVAVGNEAADVLEVIAQAGTPLVGMPLKDLALPKGALAVSMLRGTEVYIPNGNTVFEADDHVVILCARDVMSAVETHLAFRA